METENRHQPQPRLPPVAVAGGPVTALSQRGFPPSPVGLQLVASSRSQRNNVASWCSTSLVGCADICPRGLERSW